MGAALELDCYVVPAISSFYFGRYENLTATTVSLALSAVRSALARKDSIWAKKQEL
jgi:hypothetical protein